MGSRVVLMSECLKEKFSYEDKADVPCLKRGRVALLLGIFYSTPSIAALSCQCRGLHPVVFAENEGGCQVQQKTQG